MKIARFEHLHADAGWRIFSFLKVVTDDGLVGWAEYNEGYGAGGLTALLRKFADVVIGMDPREVGRISTTLHAMTLLAHGGLNAQAIAVDRERLPRYQGQGARRSGLCAVRRAVPRSHPALLVALRQPAGVAARSVRGQVGLSAAAHAR